MLCDACPHLLSEKLPSGAKALVLASAFGIPASRDALTRISNLESLCLLIPLMKMTLPKQKRRAAVADKGSPWSRLVKLPAGAIGDALREAAHRFAGELRDDLTLLVLKFP